MATRISTASRNAAAAAVAALADAGLAAAEIEVRSGAQPATADTAASGTLLATFTLADPSFTGPVAGVMTLDATPPLAATGLADDNAGWFRLYDSDANPVLDGSVTATGGGGQLELNTIAISTGVDVEITAGTITMPAG